MQALGQVVEQGLVPELALEQVRVLALGQVLVPVRVQERVQGLRVPAQVAPAWVLVRGQARVKGALAPVMEPAMAVLVRRMVRVLAPVPPASNLKPSRILQYPLTNSPKGEGEGIQSQDGIKILPC
jgi:hypothetical protein